MNEGPFRPLTLLCFFSFSQQCHEVLDNVGIGKATDTDGDDDVNNDGSDNNDNTYNDISVLIQITMALLITTSLVPPRW